MPILYVNPARSKKRFSFAKKRFGAGKKRRNKSKRKGRMPAALAAYWAKKRSKKSSRRKARKALVIKKRRAKAKRTRRSKMSKRRKKGSRRRGRKRSKKSYARAARLGARRRKARKSGGKRRRRGRRSRKSSRRRRRKSSRSRKSYRRAAKLGRRRRRRKMHGPIYRRSKAGRGGTRMGHGAITLVMPKRNPSRRRRSRSRRRGRRTAARLGHRRRRARRAKRSRGGRRRYRKFGRLRGRTVYVRNPGKMLIDLAKKAVPIVLSTVASKTISAKLGPRIPMLDRLGAFQGPVISILAVLGANYATKKVAFLAKRRDSILMGFTIAAIHETISALAPASVKGLLGMGDSYTQALADYVATNDYEQVADGMSDYVATGDMEQEMGFDQEMGDLGPFGQGGLGGAKTGAFLAPVPTQKFLAPVPSHSFTAPVPEINDEYDNPKMLYTGIFNK